MPQRIQRKRTKGWRMPEGAVSVTRPGRWGNPFVVGEPYRFDDDGQLAIGIVGSPGAAVDLFSRYLAARPDHQEMIRRELGGRDLACWCPLPAPGETDHCHADVLLDIANT